MASRKFTAEEFLPLDSDSDDDEAGVGTDEEDSYESGELPASPKRDTREEEQPQTPETSATPMATAVDGVNTEVVRLLRQPRYFDEDELEADAAKKCFNCGEPGHLARDCPHPKRKPCFVCGQYGHEKRNCPNGLCFNCNKPGHLAKDCPERPGAFRQPHGNLCLRCGRRGHTVDACELMYEDADLARIRCYVCNKLGHLACMVPLCTDTSTALPCYKCGSKTHSGLTCTVGDGYRGHRGNGYGQKQQNTSITCYRCHQVGHFARDCTADISPDNRSYDDYEPYYKRKKRPRVSDDRPRGSTQWENRWQGDRYDDKYGDGGYRRFRADEYRNDYDAREWGEYNDDHREYDRGRVYGKKHERGAYGNGYSRGHHQQRSRAYRGR